MEQPLLRNKHHRFILTLDYVFDIIKYKSSETRNSSDEVTGINALFWRTDYINNDNNIVRAFTGTPTTSLEIGMASDQITYTPNNKVTSMTLKDDKGDILLYALVSGLTLHENLATMIVLLSSAQIIPVSNIIQKLKKDMIDIPEFFYDPKHYLGDMLIANENYFL